HGSKMHYVDEGAGDPILFLHGNPTSSYLWRNIIPYAVPHGRCIAPDLIGMGKSDKPNLRYRFLDHYKYIEGFIEKLELKNIAFVIHDWGSGLGFHYAMGHEENVRGIAFMEAIVKTVSWKGFNKDFKVGFKLMRSPFIGWLMISVMNVFVKQILPRATVRKLDSEEKRIYQEPYQTIASRKPLRQWPCEIPIDGKPADMHELISAYSQKLQESDLPKLLFYATPGGIITSQVLDWCKQNFKNLKTVDIGAGIHYLQEDNPHKIGEELAKWLQSL
ncbi:haloalkane dehalogenase, partial [candidate division KSB1 bacterium]|nr:haloalkane dehalogenase [candidate division KSB1 bacterium]